MDDSSDSSRALAVALVAMSKAISSAIPSYAKSLELALSSAETAGMAEKDLAILRLLIQSARSTVRSD